MDFDDVLAKIPEALVRHIFCCMRNHEGGRKHKAHNDNAEQTKYTKKKEKKIMKNWRNNNSNNINDDEAAV